ncbi:MAG: mechanosensitive ion channel [Rhodospirillales bacterium]|nr:mechanosensitive ion channel [Rhodospirillales bacterium]
MEKVFDLTDPLIAAISRMIQNLLEYLPQLFGGIILLMLGWLVAKGLRALTIRLAGSMDRIFDIAKLGKHEINESTASTLGSVVYWIVLLFFATSAANILGLTLFTTWLDRLISQLPNILAGALMLTGGFIFGNIARSAVLASLSSTPLQQRELFGRTAQIAILVIMATIAAGQIGIDITIVVAVVAITLGGLFFALALAFGLGFRAVAGNLVATRYLKNEFKIGDSIRIGTYEGQIIAITSVFVALSTPAGRVVIPAHTFSDQPSLLLDKDPANA